MRQRAVGYTPPPKCRSKLRPRAIDAYPLEASRADGSCPASLTPAPSQPVRRKPLSTAPPSRSQQKWVLAIAAVLFVLCLGFWLVVALSR